jgi:hypothetical protein
MPIAYRLVPGAIVQTMLGEVGPKIWTGRQVNVPPYYSDGVRRFHDHGSRAKKA